MNEFLKSKFGQKQLKTQMEDRKLLTGSIDRGGREFLPVFLALDIFNRFITMCTLYQTRAFQGITSRQVDASQTMDFVFDRVKNTVGKEENADY